MVVRVPSTFEVCPKRPYQSLFLQSSFPSTMKLHQTLDSFSVKLYAVRDDRNILITAKVFVISQSLWQAFLSKFYLFENCSQKWQTGIKYFKGTCLLSTFDIKEIKTSKQTRARQVCFRILFSEEI